MPETIHVLTESGVALAMDLPLNDGIAQRLEKGFLRRIHPDGSPWTPPLPAALTSTGPPARAAPKAEWIGWAATSYPDPTKRLSAEDASALTKQDLIDRFGELPAADPT